MKYYFVLFFIVLTLFSCCKDENINKEEGVVWKIEYGNDMIGEIGLGYPIYKDIVVFHLLQ